MPRISRRVLLSQCLVVGILSIFASNNLSICKRHKFATETKDHLVLPRRLSSKKWKSVWFLVSRYFRQHTKVCPVSISRRKTQSVCSCTSLLIYPRLISFESDCGSGSTRHGWLQALSTSTITLKMPQAPEGLFSRKKTFCFRFWSSFKNEGPRQGCHTSATAHRSRERMS